MFLDNLLGLELERAAELNIELAHRTTTISKAPYKMALTELQKLKK